jgi:phage-related protein
MSFNLVDLVKGQISGQVLGQISNAVGENADATKSVIDSAVPALLGGLMNKASSDEGASALFDTIKNQDDSILDNLSGVIASKNKDSLVEGGSNMLGSLFGGDAAAGLMGAVSGVSGASQGSTSKILGMVAPLAMSTVKRYMSGGGEMDKAGLASMLMDQKDNIAGAMPSGLADQLGSSGLLSNVGNLFGGAGAATDAVSDAAGNVADLAGGAVDGVAGKIGDAASSATDAVSGAADKVGDLAGGAVDGVTGAVGNVADGAANLAGSATDAASDAAGGVKDAAEGGASWIKKLIPIAILAALAFLALKYFGGKAPEAPDVSTAAPAAVTSMVEGGGVTDQLKGMFGSVQTSLGGITDVESAKAAIPQLTDFSGKLDGVTAMADKLPEAAKPMFNTVVQGGMGQLQPMLDKVMAIPGVESVLGGVIGPLKEKLAALGS